MKDVRNPIDPNSTRFVDRLRICMRNRNLAYSTEKTYVQWILRYIRHNNRRHPVEMGTTEVEQYLQHMATVGRYSKATQRLALNALVFLYHKFLASDLGKLNFSLANKHQKLPVAFSSREINLILNRLNGKYALAVRLLYGSGLRISELCRLRIKDIDFDLQQIIVCDGKGGKDRITLLPEASIEQLKIQIAISKSIHQEDLVNGNGEVYLPDAMGRLNPSAHKETGWQFLFPASKLSLDMAANLPRRHHIDESAIRKIIKKAIRQSEVTKHASTHSFRHSFATHMLQNGCNIRKLQELMGHSCISTTAIYIHVANLLDTVSPLDRL